MQIKTIFVINTNNINHINQKTMNIFEITKNGKTIILKTMMGRLAVEDNTARLMPGNEKPNIIELSNVRQSEKLTPSKN